MTTFIQICVTLVCSAIIWRFFFTFCASDSTYQLYRFRKALDSICEHLDLSSDMELNIIHKNKKFAISIVKSNINNHYSTYEIFINGNKAAIYHRLEHMWMSSYHFEEVNKRHRDEVESIIYAGVKAINKFNNPAKEKKDGYTEYSYFN